MKGCQMNMKPMKVGDVELKIAKNDYDEYEVRWFKRGKQDKGKTYFTPDKDDAMATRCAMAHDISKKRGGKRRR